MVFVDTCRPREQRETALGNHGFRWLSLGNTHGTYTQKSPLGVTLWLSKSATKASNTDGRNHGMENNNEREYSIFPRKQRKNGFFTICRCLSKKDKYFDSGLSRVEHVGVHLYHSGVSPVFKLVTRFYRGDIYIEGRPRS